MLNHYEKYFLLLLQFQNVVNKSTEGKAKVHTAPTDTEAPKDQTCKYQGLFITSKAAERHLSQIVIFKPELKQAKTAWNEVNLSLFDFAALSHVNVFIILF